MGSTYFFRDLQTLNLICEHVLPDVSTRRYINIWSAGCASGPEPYTMAIIIREHMDSDSFSKIKIYATDYDPTDELGKIVRSGSYPAEELERIPENCFSKYFSPDTNQPGNYVISEEIRNSVEFLKHDLLTLKPVKTNFSLIVCKNVLLHFKEEDRINAIRMFYDALENGGYIMTEHTQKMPEEVENLFERVVSNAQLFRKTNSGSQL